MSRAAHPMLWKTAAFSSLPTDRKRPAMLSAERHLPAALRRNLCGLFSASVALSLLFIASTPARAEEKQMAMKVTPKNAATDGHVWGALVYASDVKPEKADPDPEEFPNLHARLGKAFHYKHFSVLGQHNQDVFRQYESWVVPSKDLFLKLDSKGAAANGGINLHLQFWHGQQVLVKTDLVLRESSPLFIAGPKWRDGRLIFVLMLKKPEVKIRR